jgi:hypothetical protein
MARISSKLSARSPKHSIQPKESQLELLRKFNEEQEQINRKAKQDPEFAERLLVVQAKLTTLEHIRTDLNAGRKVTSAAWIGVRGKAELIFGYSFTDLELLEKLNNRYWAKNTPGSIEALGGDSFWLASRPSKNKRGGGRRPKYTEAEKRMFQYWWLDYKKSLDGKRPSHEDFLEWGNENAGVGFPTKTSEIENLKRAIRYDKKRIQRQN